MLTHADVLGAWDDLKAELLRYPAPPAPVAGYLPGGAPEPYYDLRPAIAALKRWSKRLGWPAADQPGVLIKRADGLLVGYALNVKLRNAMSVPDTVAWIDEMGAVVEAAGGDFEELLDELYARERQVLRVASPAPACPTCNDRRWVRDERLNPGPNVPHPVIGCPRCNPGARL